MNIIKFDNHKTLLNIKNCNKKGVYSYIAIYNNYGNKCKCIFYSIYNICNDRMVHRNYKWINTNKKICK
jgi:hypothetical protein